MRDGVAEDLGETRLWMSGQGLVMDRPAENLATRLRACAPIGSKDISGCYHCGELDARLTVAGGDGLFYGAFSGFLGAALMELLTPIGDDVWALPCTLGR